MLYLHILAGFIALAAGAVALSSRKGAYLHRRGGSVFVVAMLAMAAAGGVIAASQMFDELVHRMNVAAAAFTAYLVLTAWLTVRRPVEQHRWMHVGGMIWALSVGLMAILFGVDALDTKGYGPPPVYFTFGALALLAAALDARMLLTGRLEGVSRIVRHLWRMTLAMLIATASFFLGQADEIPAPLRNFALLSIPVILVLLSLLYWLGRMWLQARRSNRAALPKSIVQA